MVYFSSQILLNPPQGELCIADRDPRETIAFSLIVPTYNEAKNVSALVHRITLLLDPLYPNDYEIIIVDDNSPDRTWEVAQSITPEYPQLRVMRRQTERGLSTAVIRGWQAANGEVLGVIDGDLQHPPEVLLGLLEKMRQGYDFAIASRHVEGGGCSDWGLIRRILSRGAQILGLIILPSVVGRVTDPMSGCFMVKRDAISNVILDPLGYKISLEVIGRGRVERIAEVGYVFQERQEGESKVTRQQYIDYLRHLVKLRSRGRISSLRNKIPFPVGRLLRFGVVGLSGVVVDMAMLYFLSDPTMLAMGLTRSKIIASEVAILNNFLWNDRWTFGDLAQGQTRKRQVLKRFIKFNLVCLMGLILNVLILNTLFNGFGINRYVANFIAIAIVTLWNFWINLKLNWRVTDV
jgi:dolichol-phosphate mannosyltransferase